MPSLSYPSDRPQRLISAAHSSLSSSSAKQFFTSPLKGFHIKPSYTLVGALLFTAATGITGLSLRDTAPQKPSTHQTSLTSDSAVGTRSAASSTSKAAASAPEPSIDSNTSTPAAGSTNTSSVQITVNGQDVNVPSNGTTQQTVTGADGGTTTITASGSQSSTGQSVNTSITSVHSHINNGNASISITEQQNERSP